MLEISYIVLTPITNIIMKKINIEIYATLQIIFIFIYIWNDKIIYCIVLIIIKHNEIKVFKGTNIVTILNFQRIP